MKVEQIGHNANVDELPTGVFKPVTQYVLFESPRGVLQYDFGTKHVFLIVTRFASMSIVIAIRAVGDVRPLIHRKKEYWSRVEVINEK